MTAKGHDSWNVLSKQEAWYFGFAIYLTGFLMGAAFGVFVLA